MRDLHRRRRGLHGVFFDRPPVPAPAICRCSTHSKAQFWPPNRRVPAKTMPDANAIPVIDLGPYLADEPGALDRSTAELRHALTGIGFDRQLDAPFLLRRLLDQYGSAEAHAERIALFRGEIERRGRIFDPMRVIRAPQPLRRWGCGRQGRRAAALPRRPGAHARGCRATCTASAVRMSCATTAETPKRACSTARRTRSRRSSTHCGAPGSMGRLSPGHQGPMRNTLMRLIISLMARFNSLFRRNNSLF